MSYATAKHKAKLLEMRRTGNTQQAAEYLARLAGIEQQNAMDVATELGFRVEFYANSIRVELDSWPMLTCHACRHQQPRNVNGGRCESCGSSEVWL